MGGEIKHHTWYEFRTEELVEGLNVQKFDDFLTEVWNSRLQYQEIENDFYSFRENQRFFEFTWDGRIKPRNYVGCVQFDGNLIEIRPKIFQGMNLSRKDFWDHLFFWLSYCKKIHFPFNKVESQPDFVENIPECLIYTFAKHTYELISKNPFSQYEELIHETMVPRGRIKINDYINTNFSKGRPHHLIVESEPFLYDNKVNQVIKYVATLLQYKCRYSDTFHELQKIILLLEVVSDYPAVSSDCQAITFNHLFSDYRQIVDMCEFFLENSYLGTSNSDLANFSFLFPMEYVFEEFIAGFLETHLSDEFIVKAQSTDYLTNESVFQIKPDLSLHDKETNELKLLIDTKYKIREATLDNKKGISQSDIYQMISYAIRKNCRSVLLLYPAHIKSSPGADRFSVISQLFSDQEIEIFALDIPVIDENLNTLKLENILIKLIKSQLPSKAFNFGQ